MARPPSLTVTRSTRTTCCAFARYFLSASICARYVRLNLVIDLSCASQTLKLVWSATRPARVAISVCVATICPTSIASTPSRGSSSANIAEASVRYASPLTPSAFNAESRMPLAASSVFIPISSENRNPSSQVTFTTPFVLSSTFG